MQLNGKLVSLDAADYRRQIEHMRYEREILRCLIELDVSGIRKLWREMAPHLDQPENDWQALRTMHEARVRMKHISAQQKRYSEHWLREHKEKTMIVNAVGIMVKSLSGSGADRASDIQSEMGEAVLRAINDGVDIEAEVPELHARMKAARERFLIASKRK